MEIKAHRRSWLTVALSLALANGACGDEADVLDDGDGDAGDDDVGDGGSKGEQEVPTFNGCPAASYEDHTSAGDARVIEIAMQGLTYTPKCMTIGVGQTVRWEGSLATHPLARGNAADADAGSPNSPIVSTSSGQSVEFTFEEPGVYPYYCTVHGFGAGQGMSGSIRVQ